MALKLHTQREKSSKQVNEPNIGSEVQNPKIRGIHTTNIYKINEIEQNMI